MADEAQPQQKKPSKALGWLALLLSILGMGCAFLGPGGAIAGAVLGVLAIVLELRAPERHAGGGPAMAAVLIGGAGVFFWYSARPYISSRGELRNGSSRTGSNEAGAIGNLRALASAEAAYFSAAGIGYVAPECLPEPRKCAPNLSSDTPPFLDKLVLSKTGAYVITFHPGAKATEAGFQSFAAVSVPRLPGETGRRAFCIDSTGTIRYTPDGKAPAVENGLCATSTPELR